MATRSQLSMYLPEPRARQLESVRRILDPLQSSLIPAHVTLCREDELALIGRDSLAARFRDVPESGVTLQFGRPELFHEHGILVPCIAGERDFHLLREHILGSRSIRRHAPHITLAHPRNPRAAGNCLANANVLPQVFEVTFTGANLIEQTGSAAWHVLRTFELCRAP